MARLEYIGSRRQLQDFFGRVVKAPDCRNLVCSSVHVTDKQSLGKAGRLRKAPDFSSESKKKAIGRHESNQTVFYMYRAKLVV